MKIAFIIPFYYKWNTFANVRANYEYLKKIYDIDIFTKKESLRIDLNSYDLIMLHGSGSFLTDDQYANCKRTIFGFGWSDPNIFNETHFMQSDIYFTNDLSLSKQLNKIKTTIYYQTACDKRYHGYLNLKKETDILVYGQGSHKFVTDRNETVNKLRKEGFNIKVFGRGWDINKDTYKFIEGQDLIKEINKAHIVLDLSNKTTSWPHRIFEASACGTPVITINREDTKLLFGDESIFYYENYDDLFVSLNVLLHHKGMLRVIGNEARKMCYKEHDISKRIYQLTDMIDKL